VVVEVAWVNGLAAIRSLGRHGIRVMAVDHRPYALGFKSRYATPVTAPDPAADEDGFIRAMLDLGARLDAPAPLFPTHDEHLGALARHESELAGSFVLSSPGWEALQQIQLKRHQIEQAIACGVPVPETRHPQSAAEALAAGEELGYPLFVKPSDPVEFKRVHRRQGFRCDRPADLEQAYAAMQGHQPMVQEFIPGGDDGLYTLGSYLSRDLRPLGLFCGRKLRQTGEHMGTCRAGESVWVDAVVDDGLRLLRQLGCYGVSQVEFKLDPRDGVYKLIEVNPRLWQWHGLSGACGVDITHIAYLDLCGFDPPPTRMTREGHRWSITFMSGTRSEWQRPPYTDGVFALDDPRPALAHVGRLARRRPSRPATGRTMELTKHG
jgi:predicted ATP-grasp superfamily ATP-dependent carboligase